MAAGIALAELSYICVIRWKKTERFRLWMEKKRNMKNKKKIIGNGIFLFLVLGLTLYGVFHGEDLGLIWENVKKADNRYLFPQSSV